MSNNHKKLSECPNCNTALEEAFEFCPNCGQANHDIKVPISHLGYEFFEGFTHFDTKLWNTLKSIFTKPGMMTKEFLEGKRAKYVPPPRFYIFVSVIFFLLLGSTVSHAVEHQIKNNSWKKNLSIKAKGLSYDMDEKMWRQWLSLDTLKADSLLVATKNPMAKNHKILRDSVYISLQNYWSKKDKKDGGYEKDERNMEKDTSSNNMHISFGADSTDKNIPNKLSKSTSKSEEMLKEIDTLYYKLRPNLSDDYNNVGYGFFGHNFTPKEIEFLKNADDHQVDSVVVARKITTNKENSIVMYFIRNFTKRIYKFENLELINIIPITLKAYSFCMFLLMPLIAFLTWLFFRKERKYYVEHLIFSIHSHSFLFLIYSLILLFFMTTHIMNWWIMMLLLIGLWVYLFVSLKTVFKESNGKTFIKFLLINFIYLIIANTFSLFSLAYGVVNF